MDQRRDPPDRHARPRSTNFPNSRFVADFIGSINMFEGTSSRTDGDMAACRLPELGGDGRRRGAIAGSRQGQQGLASRSGRKRSRITARAARRRPNAVAGMVADLGYFGKDSLYRVKLASGRVVSVNRVNARRAGEGERVAQWEDEVWLSFEPSAAILLTE